MKLHLSIDETKMISDKIHNILYAWNVGRILIDKQEAVIEYNIESEKPEEVWEIYTVIDEFLMEIRFIVKLDSLKKITIIFKDVRGLSKPEAIHELFDGLEWEIDFRERLVANFCNVHDLAKILAKLDKYVPW